MTDQKDTGPGTEALRRLNDDALRAAVAEYTSLASDMDSGPARSAIERLIAAGRDELRERERAR